MISKLRRKFISITAAALFAMILLVIAAINCVYIYQSGKMLESRLVRIMEGREKGLPPFDMKPAIHPDGCLILLDGQGNLKEIRQNAPAHYSEEDLLTLAQQILQEKRHSGWHQYFRYRLEVRTLPDETAEIRIGLVNASADLYSVFTMLIISVSIGILSFLLVLFIIILASGRAVRPIAESYERQKQFVTDAGHELKTPLTVISADSELARMTFGPSEWFDGIDAQVTKMTRLVHSLITLARMDEGQATVFSLFSLSDAVYDTAKSFENLIFKAGKQLSLDIQEEILCTGDESMLRQAAAILMDNAAKYCDEKGMILVRLTEDRGIRLQVINDYAASGDCDLSRVFQRFYRADKARTPDGSYGLGLSIAKSIVEQHKGTIQAKALDHGRLMFEITLRRSGRK